MDAARIAVAPNGRRLGDRWLCRCPCMGHGKRRGDQHPSLSLCDSSHGRVLLHCHAGCAPQDVIAALRSLDLWPRRLKRRVRRAVGEHQPDRDDAKRTLRRRRMARRSTPVWLRAASPPIYVGCQRFAGPGLTAEQCQHHSGNAVAATGAIEAPMELTETLSKFSGRLS